MTVTMAPGASSGCTKAYPIASDAPTTSPSHGDTNSVHGESPKGIYRRNVMFSLTHACTRPASWHMGPSGASADGVYGESPTSDQRLEHRRKKVNFWTLIKSNRLLKMAPPLVVSTCLTPWQHGRGVGTSTDSVTDMSI